MLFLQLFVFYLGLGLIFGIAFIIRGYAIIDSAASNSGLIVRLMLLPASILLWPLLLRRWYRAVNKKPAAGAEI